MLQKQQLTAWINPALGNEHYFLCTALCGGQGQAFLWASARDAWIHVQFDWPRRKIKEILADVLLQFSQSLAADGITVKQQRAAKQRAAGLKWDGRVAALEHQEPLAEVPLWDNRQE